MSYYSLTADDIRIISNQVVDEQRLASTVSKICSIRQIPMASQYTFQRKLSQAITELETWSPALETIDVKASINYETVTVDLHRGQRTFRIPKAQLQAASATGKDLKFDIVSSMIADLEKELEAYLYKGEVFATTGTRTTTTATRGLCKEAGQTSTYHSGGFDAATEPYKTVADMKGLLLAQNHGSERLDLIADKVLGPKFLKQQGAGLKTEGQAVKEELLNGGDIFTSDQLIAPSANNGTLLLVENKAVNYELVSPNQFSLDPDYTYYAGVAEFEFRIDGLFGLLVKRPNAICIHHTVKLAA